MRYDSGALAAAELRFREGIWSAAPHDAIEELEIRKRWFGPVLATTCAGLPDSEAMNAVQGAAEPGAIADGHLAAAVEWMRSREVDYLVQVSSDRPGSEEAEAWLAARGYEQGPMMRRYVRALEGLIEENVLEVDVRELNAAQTEGISLIFAEALGLSDLATVPMLGLPELEGWHCYTAYLDEREVACGSLLLRDGVAVLGLDATLAVARHHGCHTALIQRRLHKAATAGCGTVMAEACDIPSERAAAGRNLQRAGFVEAGRSIGWRRPLPAKERLHRPFLLR